MHEKNAAKLLIDGLVLDDPGAPERVKLTAHERMARARSKPELVAANQRWSASYGVETHPTRIGSKAKFAARLVQEVIEAPEREAPLLAVASISPGASHSAADAPTPSSTSAEASSTCAEAKVEVASCSADAKHDELLHARECALEIKEHERQALLRQITLLADGAESRAAASSIGDALPSAHLGALGVAIVDFDGSMCCPSVPRQRRAFIDGWYRDNHARSGTYTDDWRVLTRMRLEHVATRDSLDSSRRLATEQGVADYHVWRQPITTGTAGSEIRWYVQANRTHTFVRVGYTFLLTANATAGREGATADATADAKAGHGKRHTEEASAWAVLEVVADAEGAGRKPSDAAAHRGLAVIRAISATGPPVLSCGCAREKAHTAAAEPAQDEESGEARVVWSRVWCFAREG